MSCGRARHTAASGGFTLIEVLAAVFLTSIVLSMAVAFYIDLTNAGRFAADTVRSQLHATAVLGRVARDLESAYLIEKPPEDDPLNHPWMFVGESHYGFEGADRLRFMTRSHRARVGEKRREGDLVMVTLMLRPDEVGTYELLRWVSPHIPHQLERDFPSDESTAVVLADGLDYFAVRFLGDGGEWLSEWDSTQIVESSALPVAVEIAARVAPENASVDGLDEPASEPEPPLIRRVLLPVRPIDLLELVERAQGLDNDASCYTFAQCLSHHAADVWPALGLTKHNDKKVFLRDNGKLCVSDLPEAAELADVCVPVAPQPKRGGRRSDN